MKRFLTATLAALALLLIVGGGARADILPPEQIQWTYNWSPAAPALLADGNPSAGVTFTNEPTKVAMGNSDIVASNIRVFSTGTAQAPDLMTGSNGNYALKLTLSTNYNGTPFTQSMTFSGTLNGPFSAENAHLLNTFSSDASQEVILGQYRFTVSMHSYTPPGPPDQSNAGSFAAHVTVEDKTNPDPDPNGAPEPSTILLSGLGLTFLGTAAWRRRRKARAARS
jgi:hypothetical protein